MRLHVLGMALLGGAAFACTADTGGLGSDTSDDASDTPGESGETDGDGDGDGDTTGDGDGDGDGDTTGDGDATGDGDGDATGDGDGDPVVCAEVDDTVSIEAYGPDYNPTTCIGGGLVFDFTLSDSANNVFEFVECPCEDPECGGAMHTYTFDMPDPVGWLPGFDGEDCGTIALYTELVGDDECEQTRVDIMFGTDAQPSYSIGNARTALDKNGLAISPVNPEPCAESCADWELRDLMFEIAGESGVVPFAMEGSFPDGEGGEYTAVNWHAYQILPKECAPNQQIVERSAWTAIK